MAHSVIGNIVLNPQVVDSMNSDRPVEGVMDGIVPNIGGMHGTYHMEMDWVRSQDEGLADIIELDTIDSSG